ncbi:hypothetical protein GCM10010272_69290 [Streptomyces lateritius]|nr:hypothetical protein GCM10010272_69290 [Streptomyces lateritius]
MAGAGGGQVLGELAGRVGAQRDRAADGTEAAGRVVPAEDKEVGACEGAGDRADDRFGDAATGGGPALKGMARG